MAKCALCLTVVDDNYGNDDVFLCDSCSQTQEGMALIQPKKEDIIHSSPPEEPRITVKSNGDEMTGVNRMLTGIVIGLVVAGLLWFGGNAYIDYSRTSLAVKVINTKGYETKDVEVLYYAKVPMQGGELINMEATGLNGKNRFQAEIQYLEGRKMEENGLVLKVGSSTYSSGTFYR